ncbi:MAG TPA: S-layer homology domain-containing protein, partial [Ruminiclostridium sp.]|nr:S-layer homology domain-containing protein [Ruminiclostridium sp.]
GLAAITIPASVATIGEYALNDCDSLSYIKMNSSTPPTVGEYAFEGIPTGAVQVPAGCASAYKAVDDGDTTDNMWYGLTVIDEGVTGKIITRVEEINKIVPWGTSIADVGLPDKVEVSLSDGSTIKVDTEWDNGQPEYDGNKDGGYFFTGTLKNLPSGINNDIGKTAEAYVVVDTLKSAKLSPAAFSFDLDAPKDIVSQITWNNAGVVRNVVYNSGAGQADIKHTLNGNTLSISKDDMLALNPKEGTSIQFEIFFDKGDSTKFTVDVFKGYHPGTDASLSSLKMHGFDYPGFNPGKYSYELILPQGVTPGDIYSLIEATPKDPKAKVVITPAATLPGCTTIEVTAENGITKLTYTINFKASAYTVTFDKNGGDTEANPSSKTAAAGVSLDNLPTAPTRSGYTFNGWNTKQDGSGTSFTATTPVTANITVYAQWTVNATNGGGGGSSGNTPTNANTNSTPSTSVTTNAGNNSSGVTSSITTEAKTDSNGKAAATVSEGQVKEAVSKAVAEAAKKGKGTEAKVEIKVNTSADVKTVETSLPKSAVATVADNKTDALTIVTPAANVTFDKTAINTILNEATADIKITVSKVETTSLPRETQEAAGDRPVYNFSVTSGGKTISQFGGNVTVSVPYTPKAGEDINAIVIYYINAEGKLELVNNCVYDPSIGAITFKTNHFSLYTVGYNKVIFKDVTANAWYGKAVGFVAAREITTGTGNGNYSPNAQLTRAEFLVMVMKAYGIKPDERITDNFADSGNTYYTGYLAAAKRLGITAGIGNNMFEPNKKITRQEMAALLYNLLKQLGELPTITTGKTLDSYSDSKDVAIWAKDAMDFLVEAGTVGGSSGKLSPESKTTRAEMAQVLYNLLSK